MRYVTMQSFLQHPTILAFMVLPQGRGLLDSGSRLYCLLCPHGVHRGTATGQSTWDCVTPSTRVEILKALNGFKSLMGF